MKIAVPATQSNPNDALVDERFGRAPHFLIYDSEAKTWDLLDNAAAQESVQGAGVHSAELLSRRGLQAVLTPHCGPKAFRVLRGAEIEVYLGASGRVADAVEDCLSGRLHLAVAPDVQGHW